MSAGNKEKTIPEIGSTSEKSQSDERKAWKIRKRIKYKNFPSSIDSEYQSAGVINCIQL